MPPSPKTDPAHRAPGGVVAVPSILESKPGRAPKPADPLPTRPVYPSMSGSERLRLGAHPVADDEPGSGSADLLGSANKSTATMTEFYSPTPDGYRRGFHKYVFVLGTVMPLPRPDMTVPRTKTYLWNPRR